LLLFFSLFGLSELLRGFQASGLPLTSLGDGKRLFPLALLFNGRKASLMASKVAFWLAGWKSESQPRKLAFLPFRFLPDALLSSGFPFRFLLGFRRFRFRLWAEDHLLAFCGFCCTFRSAFYALRLWCGGFLCLLRCFPWWPCAKAPLLSFPFLFLPFASFPMASTNTENRLHTLDQIKRAAASAGSRWFEKSALRFFSSRISSHVYSVPGGALFVSSEQFRGFGTEDEPRI
jgi:hypothetical protein